MATAHGFGTSIRRDLDPHMLGQAVKAPGVDTRYWCSQATVATLDTETGDWDVTDRHAIHNSSAGVKVDVRLEPLGQRCTCQYTGIQAGDVTIYAPIRPGNLVLVECPDGDLTTPMITHILNSRSSRQPTDGGKPIFDNNRLLIHAQSVPIDIRTAGGVKILLEQDGTVTIGGKSVKLGGATATEPLVLGNTYANGFDILLDALSTYVDAMSPVDPTGGVASAALTTAIAAFQAIAYLSPTVKTT